MTDKRAPLVWLAIVIPMWIVLVLCTHWEPVMRDGWGHFLYQRNMGLSLDSLYEFAKGTYVHNNPRLGQVLTLLLFTPGPWHEIVTPIVELSLFWLLSTLVLGRWPSPRRIDDALLFATIVALVALTAPQFGIMLFYRPYTGNYLFGLVVCLVFLLPYRFQLDRDRGMRWWLAPIMLVAGFAAGMCNEHTGPAIAGLAIAGTVVATVRDRRPTPWAIAGVIGIVAGGLALFYAPGQDVRYNALATHGGVLTRIIDRGALGDLAVAGRLFGYLVWTLPWVALAAVARWRRRDEAAPAAKPTSPYTSELAFAAGAIAITLTLLASPKIGPRLYFGAVAFACTAIASVVIRQLVTRWSRAICAAMAAAVFRVRGLALRVGVSHARR